MTEFFFSSDNVTLKLKPIDLCDELSFPDLQQVVIALNMTVNMDQLYKEFCASRGEIEEAKKDNSQSTSEKWMTVFQKKKKKLGEENQIVSFVLNVPGSNAFVERIFLLMAIKLSDSRNRCSTERTKNEQISVNCGLSCMDFSPAM